MNKTSIFLFNVGNGDHLMVKFSDDAIGIIDSFYTGDCLKLQEPPALTYMKAWLARNKENDNTLYIKFLCLSHADADHITGMSKIIIFLEENESRIIVENIWMFAQMELSLKSIVDSINSTDLSVNSVKELDRLFTNYEDELKPINQYIERWKIRNKKSVFYFESQNEILINPEFNFTPFSVGPTSNLVKAMERTNLTKLIRLVVKRHDDFINKEIEEKTQSQQLDFKRNALSAILSITVNKRNFIFMGDATNDSIMSSFKEMTNSKNIEKIKNPVFVKVSHHGSDSSTSVSIWDTLFDEKSKSHFGISAGKHAKNKHPHDDFKLHINQLKDAKEVEASIYRTNTCDKCLSKNIEDVDLDKGWFKYHGHKIDRMLKEGFEELESNNFDDNRKSEEQNLLGYLFEFSNDCEAEIGVKRCMSSKIGRYVDCVFGMPREHYCS